MKVTNINNKICLVQAKDHATLAQTFMRFQVHAYVSADADYLSEKNISFPIELHQELKVLREKHLKAE